MQRRLLLAAQPLSHRNPLPAPAVTVTAAVSPLPRASRSCCHLLLVRSSPALPLTLDRRRGVTTKGRRRGGKAVEAAMEAEAEAHITTTRVACNVYVTAAVASSSSSTTTTTTLQAMSMNTTAAEGVAAAATSPHRHRHHHHIQKHRKQQLLCEKDAEEKEEEGSGRRLLLVRLLEEAQQCCRDLSSRAGTYHGGKEEEVHLQEEEEASAKFLRYSSSSSSSSNEGGDGKAEGEGYSGSDGDGDGDGGKKKGRATTAGSAADGPTSSRLRLRKSKAAAEDAVVLVHAFCDPVYGRSSFHLAGTAPLVAQAAARIALRAFQRFTGASSSDASANDIASANGGDDVHPHPSVGIVDHVSVLPLVVPIVSEDAEATAGVGGGGDDDAAADAAAASSAAAEAAAAWAAVEIGQELERSLVAFGTPRVLYYGLAHPANKSLAKVRREETDFFRSTSRQAGRGSAAGGAAGGEAATAADAAVVVVVGAPPHFVENWNVRLSGSGCSRSVAMALTKKMRSLCGGGEGGGGGGGGTVEALTLPYSRGRWEVACNLLRPDLVSSEVVEECARAWLKSLTPSESDAAADASVTSSPPSSSPSVRIAKSYRVGTTARQCLQALEDVAGSAQGRDRHDALVMERFKEDMTAGQ